MKFRELIEQFTRRLKDVTGRMTSSQRMSLGMLAGVVALVLVIFIVMNLGSSGGSWEKLFYTDLDAEQQQYVINKLGTEEFKTEDGTIMVRASDRSRLAAIFFEDEKIVSGEDFFKNLFEPNFIETNRLRDIKYVHAREKQIASWVGHFKQVRRASVGINPGDPNAYMNQDQRKPTASVMVELASGVSRLPNSTVKSIASMVAGPIKGLDSHSVSISDRAGNYYRIPQDNENYASDSEKYKIQQQIIRDMEDKIYNLLPDIPSLRVAFYVKIDWDKAVIHKENVTGDIPVKEIKEESTGGSAARNGGTPGVVPNITDGMDIGKGTGGKPSASVPASYKKTTKEPLNNRTSITIEDIIKSWGDVVEASVTVTMPYDILAKPFKGGQVSADDAEATKTMQENIKRYVAICKQTAGITDESKISIVPRPVFEKEELEEDSVVTSVWQDFKPYLGKAFIAIIAFGSLLLVASFVKKNIPKAQQIPIEEIEEKIEQEVAKEKKDFLAELGKLDESEMKAIQVKDRVQDMVGENPENAAGLLKTWINKEE